MRKRKQHGPKSNARFCRDARAVAAAWGVKVYSRRGMRARQLDPVRAALEKWVAGPSGPDCPARQQRGWPRDEVAKFGRRWVDLSADRRDISIRTEPRAEGASGALGELFDTARQARLTSHLKAWGEGKPPKYFERFPLQELLDAGIPHEALAKAGLVTAQTSGAPRGDLYEPVSLRELAKLLSDLYGEYIDPMRLSRCFTERGAEGRRTNGSIVPAVFIKWWDENERPKNSGRQGRLYNDAAAADMQKKIDDARRSKLEADELERSLSRKWVLADAHEHTLNAAGLAARNSARDTLEKQFPLRFAERLPEFVQNENAREQLRVFVGGLCRELFDAWQKQMAARMGELLGGTRQKEETLKS
jgi:hypothetical protein